MNYGRHVSRLVTPQGEPIPNSTQVANSAGGYAWPVDDWVRLDRFLILGSEGGSYYVSERKLTRENAAAVERCIKADGPRTVARIAEISHAGRAPKNDPAILALALAAKLGDEPTRRAAFAALPSVCRIGTHLHHFAEYVQHLGGWGRGTRRAIASWYNDQEAKTLAYQLVKYQSRDGWSNRDLLRLSHPKPKSRDHGFLYKWATKGVLEGNEGGLALVHAFEEAKTADRKVVVGLIREHNLPREAVPTEHLNDPEVWEALLERMPLHALVRNLATMTRVGLLKPLSDAARIINDRLADSDHIQRSRMHPVALLVAHRTYLAGHGMRGQNTWSPVSTVADALDAAFYLAFENVRPTGKRFMLGLDVSASMNGSTIAGIPILTARVATAAMALVTAAVEREHFLMGFSTQPVQVPITPRMRLDEACRVMSRIPMGGTDCSLPMRVAIAEELAVDSFVVYTDSETWAGGIHPSQALQEYRKRSGIRAKLAVVAMTSNGFTIADPNDQGMLDVVGFDTSTPAVLSDFAAG